MNFFFDFIENAINFILNKVFRLSLKESTLLQITQFVKFCLVGLSNTLISYITYVIFIYFNAHYLLASILLIK